MNHLRLVIWWIAWSWGIKINDSISGIPYSIHRGHTRIIWKAENRGGGGCTLKKSGWREDKGRRGWEREMLECESFPGCVFKNAECEDRICWRLTTPGCSPHIYFPFLQVGKRNYSNPKQTVALQMFHHCEPLTLDTPTRHNWYENIKHRSTNNEAQIQLLAEYLPYSRQYTQPEACGITLPSVMEVLPRKCPYKAKQKDDLEMESRGVVRHAQEVCRGRRVSVDKNIRLHVLSFVRFVITYSSRFLSRLSGHPLSCQSHSLLHTISFFFLALWYLLSIIIVRTNKRFVPVGNLGLDPLCLTAL